MRKKVSTVLALIMFLNVVLPYVPFTVYANNISLHATFDRTIDRGTVGNHRPSLSFPARATGAEEVVLYWALDAGNSVLEYYIDDGRKVQLTVNRGAGTVSTTPATVTYRLFDVTGEEAEHMDAEAYEIYRPDLGYSSLTAIENAGGLIIGDVNTDITYPEFTIVEGEGVSFIYDGISVTFLWIDGNFYWLTDGIRAGRIFDFILNYSNQQGTISETTNRKIVNGINAGSFRSIPVSDGNTIENLILDRDSDLKNSEIVTSVNTNILTMTPGEEEMVRPGQPPADLIFRFDIPLEYDPEHNTFTALPQDDTMDAIFRVNHSINSMSINIMIENLFNLSKDNISIESLAADIEIVDAAIIDNGREKRAHIRFTGMGPNMLYDEAVFNMGTGSSALYTIRPTTVGAGSIFTFLEYNFAPQDGDWLIEVSPYLGANGPLVGVYALMVGDTVGDTMIRSVVRDNTEPIVFTLAGGLTRVYQIVFYPNARVEDADSFDEQGIVASQRVEFRPDPNNISISTPRNFQVTQMNLTPSLTHSDEAELELGVRWAVSSTEIIDRIFEHTDAEELSIVYYLNRALEPRTSEIEPYARVTVLIKPNEDFNPALDEGEDNRKYLANQNIEYLTRSETVASEYVVVRQELIDGHLIRGSSGGNISYDIVIPNLTLPAFRRSVTAQSANDEFYFPNIYFLNVEMREDHWTSMSSFTSITLDDVSASLSPVQGFSVGEIITTARNQGDERNEVSSTLNWEIPVRDIRTYLQNLFGSNMPNELKIRSNMYISIDENEMANVFSSIRSTTGEERRQHVGESNIYAYAPSESTRSIYLSTTEEDVPVLDNGTGIEPREALRNGNMVMIEGITFSDSEAIEDVLASSIKQLKIDGFDVNQRYYIYIDLEISYEVEQNVMATKVSQLSNLVAFTTANFRDEAGSEDKSPATPTINTRDISTDRATIYWEPIPIINEPNVKEVIEYEVVRLTSAQVEDAMLNYQGDIEGFLAGVPSGVEQKVFRIDSTERVIKGLANGEWSNMDTGEANFDEADFENIAMIDFGLRPNQIYFYYVRVVRSVTIGDGSPIITYSVWDRTSVTTWAIQAPVDLRVDRSNVDSYDPQTEMILAFEAPISMSNLDLFGTDLNIQYVIRQSNGNWSDPITMNASTLRSNAVESTLDGHTHFTYRISGLTHSETYYFMVRIIDANGDTSMWSNVAEGRTDVDPDLTEDGKLEDDWLEYLEEKLKDLIRDPYWFAQDSSSGLVVVYRPTMFNALVATSTDTAIDLLASSQNANTLTYYIPAQALLEANSANKGFRIVTETLNILIPPATFDPSTNTTLQNVGLDIRRGDFDDYYVRVNVSLSNPTTVDSQTTASEQVDINFTVVGSLENNVQWDNSIRELLMNLIVDEMEDGDAIRIIRDMIEDDDLSEEIIEYISSYIERVRDRFIRRVDRELDDVIDKSYTIENLAKQITIAITNVQSGTSISALERVSNMWIDRPVTGFGINGFSISVNGSGVFVFVKTVVNIPQIDGMPNAYDITGLIAKYGLQDFLGSGGSIDINANATRHMVVGIISRISGAQKGADPFAYLQSNGREVSSRNQYGAISKQETIYLFMFLYEDRTSTRIETLNIRNFAIASQVTSLDERYRKSVQVALQEEFYTDTTMNAAQPSTIRDVLEILGRLNAKVNL